MGIVRKILLWGSHSATLRRSLPQYPFIRQAVRRFMPGETIHDALNAAEDLQRQGITTVVTHLGENLTSEMEARAVADHYLTVIDLIKQRQLPCEVSVKLTQLGLDISHELCHELCATLAESAQRTKNFLWIDIESSDYVDRTLALYKVLRSQYPNTGLCLQSYLYRTERDLAELLSINPTIRLVKGAYAEPVDRAYPTKRQVDENYLRLAQQCLTAVGSSGMRFGIGTHDTDIIQQLLHFCDDRGYPSDTAEIQMLYGIRRDWQQQFAKQGRRVRVLISYGHFWFPWYMRRLAERPANIWFVLKSLFAR